MDKAARILPVILCGGAGTRLWPLSRRAAPKQMLALVGAGTMLALTAERVRDPSLYLAPTVVAAAEQAQGVEREVPGLGQLILEPAPRNTAAAIALAALNAPPDALLLVLPSDHLIEDPAGFNQAVGRARRFAAEGWIVTFGMTPHRPETGYGYIERGPELGDGVFAAKRFVEKPGAETAADYVAGGAHDWNGGIFLLRADTLVAGLELHAPEILAAVRAAVAAQRQEGRQILPEPAAFAGAPAVSIDYALMEKAERVAVAPISVGWSDIGSWAALHEAADRDPAGNVTAGDVMTIDAANCLIRSDGPLVAAIGVEDLVIVATADAVLVVPRAQSQRVKEIVDRLKAEGRETWT